MRVKKIEAHALHILKDQDLKDRLSDSELRFAEGFVDALGEHFQSFVLDGLPENFQSFPEPSAGPEVLRPDPDTYVFCRINDDLGDVQLDEHNEARTPLMKGDMQVLRYLPVQQYVREGRVELV